MKYIVIAGLKETGLEYCCFMSDNFHEAIGWIEHRIHYRLNELKWDEEEKALNVDRFYEIEGGYGYGWVLTTQRHDNENEQFHEWWHLLMFDEKDQDEVS